MRIRTMESRDRYPVSELIYISLVHWYSLIGRKRIFNGGPKVCEIFYDVYESLDPGCGIVVENTRTGALMASCFYHPRPHHVTLGILNVHPNYFGTGCGRLMVDWISDFARRAGKPLRLTSSAINLDSFSLYNKAGLTPRILFQDMMLSVPAEGFKGRAQGTDQVRPARPEDVELMVKLEWEVSRITREQDCRFVIANQHQMWHTVVYESVHGVIDGWATSSNHPAINMIGPMVARNEKVALALLARQLDHHRGRSPLFLVPCECRAMVDAAYHWGAKNSELHVYQALGEYHAPQGISTPAFLPETG